MLVLGGSSHPELTAKIARRVGVKIGRVQLGHFKNMETSVVLEENVRDKDVYLIQTGGVRSNDAVVELLFIINACRLASAASVTLITPFFPYSKGDQKFSLRSPIPSKLVANMIEKAGAEHIMMLDPHSPQLVGFFNIPVDALKVEPLFCTWIKRNVPSWSECIVVAPDEGGAKRSAMIANYLELEFAMIHNRHKKSTTLAPSGDQASTSSSTPQHQNVWFTSTMVERLLKISGEVEGKDCILVDDMIDTGTTIRLALEVLHSHGARHVYVFAAHGLFSGDAASILASSPNLHKVVVTNSVPQEQSKARLGSLLDIVDISGIVSEYIRRCHYNESVSVLSDVGGDFDAKEEYVVVDEPEGDGGDMDDGVQMAVTNRPLNHVRRGYRLESVCWDN